MILVYICWLAFCEDAPKVEYGYSEFHFFLLSTQIKLSKFESIIFFKPYKLFKSEKIFKLKNSKKLVS
jgi:hypothetical protein